MAGRPMKFTETKPTDGLRSGEVGVRSKRSTNSDPIGPTSTTSYINVINPTEVGKYVVYKVDAGENPKSYSPQNDTEFIRVVNQLGGNVSTVNGALGHIADSGELFVGSVINTTGSTDVNPYSVWDALGNNPSSQNKWFNMKAPNAMNSLHIDSTPQHCLSEFVCVESQANAIYCAPFAGTRIFSYNPSENTSEEIVTATSGPSRGTFSVSAGVRYAANKPIHLYKNGAQHAVIPGTLNGTNWGFYFSRHEPINVYLYSYDDCKYAVYVDAVNISNTYLTGSLTANTVSTFTFPDDEHDNKRINIIATKPILCSVKAAGSNADKSVASIAGPFSFRRDSGGFSSTTTGVNPSTRNTNVVFDADFDSWAFDIADGSGSDSEQSVPNTQINSNYCFGQVIDNYTIVNPNGAQTVVAEYYEEDAWVTFATHELASGSNNNPTTAQTGSTNDLVSGANIWRWRGENPYYLLINDNAADEEALYGWNSGEVEAFFI